MALRTLCLPGTPGTPDSAAAAALNRASRRVRGAGAETAANPGVLCPAAPARSDPEAQLPRAAPSACHSLQIKGKSAQSKCKI